MTDQHRRPRMDLADYVRELTEPHSHVEVYQTRSLTGGGFVDARHVTHVPSLLTQLWENDVPSQAVETGTRPGFASKPAARLDALDTAVRIDLEAHRWVTDMGEHAHSTDTGRVIQQLHGLVVSADPVVRRDVTAAVRRWWTRARIVTGWDSPAWTPDATCPQCGERGSLKIRLTEHIGMCTNDQCGTTWEPTTIGVLAEHIRGESAEGRRREKLGPCWCPWPAPTVPDLEFLCPRCGSARCRHAVTRRLLVSVRRHADHGDVA